MQAARHPSPRITRTLDKFVSPKKTYIASVSIWVLLCAAHYVIFALSILHGPRTDDEVYIYHWSFLAVSFSILRLPFWIIGLVVVLLGELSYFSRKHPKL
jgi:hypothetical protein